MYKIELASVDLYGGRPILGTTPQCTKERGTVSGDVSDSLPWHEWKNIHIHSMREVLHYDIGQLEMWFHRVGVSEQ